MLPFRNPIPSADHSFVSLASQGFSAGNASSSSSLISPRINLSAEFSRALNSRSFGEIRRTFTENFSFGDLEAGQLDALAESQLLKPSPEYVQKALLLIKRESLAHLVAEFFNESEKALQLCVVVYGRVQQARQIYQPIRDALHDIPLEFNWDSCSLASPKCKFAVESFLQWDKLGNPFSSIDSSRFDSICGNLKRLGQDLAHSKRSKSKNLSGGFRQWYNCVSSSVNCTSPIPLRRLARSRPDREQVSPSCSQLAKAASEGALFVHHLSTIRPLVSRLHSTVESDKDLIRYLRVGLGEDMDRYAIHEALKHLQTNRPGFDNYLLELEDHLMLCCSDVKKARVRLFQEICGHSNSM